LESYLNKQLPENKLNLINTVITKGDKRFIHVKAFRELIKDDSFNINEINTEEFDKKITKLYLGVLERKYGSGKYSSIIKRLLILVSLLDESATVDELSFLYNLMPTDLRFLGYLSDLKGLLIIDRTNTRETFSINIGTLHEELRRDIDVEMQVNESQNAIIHEIIEKWTNWLKDRAENHADNVNKDMGIITVGESYLVANIYTLVENYYNEILNIFQDEKIKSFLLDLAEKIVDGNNKTISNLQRTKRIYSSIIAMIERTGEIVDDLKLAIMYSVRGYCHYELMLLTDALADFNRCIAILERLYDESKLFDESYLVMAYMNRGNTYDSTTDYVRALADYDQCMAIMKRMYDEGKLFDGNDLAAIYISRGGTYNSTTDYVRALTDFDRCIAILERLDERRLLDENKLAMAS